MNRIRFFYVLMITIVTPLFPMVVATFPEMVKPIELKIDDSYIYISDQNSVFVYNKNNYALVKRLGKKGEGPGEYKSHARIGLTTHTLVIYDNRKIVEYSKALEYLREVSLPFTINRFFPVGNNFVIEESKPINGKESYCFSLYNNNKEFLKYLVVDYNYLSTKKYMINSWSVARCRNNRIFISQPHKGFKFVVFSITGKKLYQIVKPSRNIKYEEKHQNLYFEKIRYFLGSKQVKRTRERARKIPAPEFVPDIKNFWVTDRRIYVKTHDIKEKTEKYIIMDLRGNILKEVFLPITFMEILTFYKNKFYFLQDSEDDRYDGWVLHEMEI
jgi:hypothetical protein